MRIVLDTNVLARAVRGGTGPASELLRIVMVPPHILILSPFLLVELSRALRYERMRKLHKLDDTQLDTYVQSLQADALLVNPPAAATATLVSADPDDDPVIATAVAGQAEILCTLDRHLRSQAVCTYCSQQGIQILTDIELLQLLRASAGPASSP